MASVTPTCDDDERADPAIPPFTEVPPWEGYIDNESPFPRRSFWDHAKIFGGAPPVGIAWDPTDPTLANSRHITLG